MAKAEVCDIVGPQDARPRVTVSVTATVRNCGTVPDYFEVTGSYTDGTLGRDASVTPTRVRLGPDGQASFIISFTMPDTGTEVLAQVWHGDGDNRTRDASRRIAIASVTSSERKTLVSKLVDQLSTQCDFQQRQRRILQGFRLATNQRKEAEAEAVSFQKQGKQQADKELADTQSSAAEHLNRARQKMTSVREMLSAAGLERLLDDTKKSGSPQFSAADSADTNETLVRHCTEAGRAAGRIMTDATEVRNWFLAQGERNQLNKALALLVLTLPGLLSFLLGVITRNGLLIFIGLMPPPLFMAGAHGIWDFGKRAPGQGFRANYLWLWLIAPVAPFVALVGIFKDYNASQASIDERHAPMQPQRKAVPRIRALLPDLVQSLAKAEACYDRIVERARLRHSEIMSSIEADFRCKVNEAESRYAMSWQRLQDDVRSLHEEMGLIGAPFDDHLWEDWTPSRGDRFSPHVRVGTLVDRGQWNRLRTPALVPLFGETNLVIKCSGASKDRAVEMVRCLMLRLLASVPPGKLRFTLVDPIGLGQSVASFMNLSDYDEALVGGKVWTESQHIEEQLARLTEHMEFVIQKFLRDKYATIEEYNVEAGEVAEPYRVLVVVNFPVNFTESAARRLVSIALNGPRCGVYTIITMDTEQELPYGFRRTGGMGEADRVDRRRYGADEDEDEEV